MSSNYGDLYPAGDQFPDPATYPTPEEVGALAHRNASILVAEQPLNYYATEMLMRGLAGLFNGAGNLDNQTYNRLPRFAKEASRRAADASYNYFVKLGLQDEIQQEANYAYPNGMTACEQDQLLINAMQLHVSLAAQREQSRRWSAFYGGVVPLGMEGHGMPVEDPLLAESQRAASDVPYSEEGIRGVLEVFGWSLGPVITGFAEVAPLNIDRRVIVHHAASSVRASHLED